MTPGQELALGQLKAIEAASPHAVEIFHVVPPAKEGDFLRVDITLHCGQVARAPGGLPLRERERFRILVPGDFPFARPEVSVPHVRFAGWPHVQWKQHLCLYQAPETEWNVTDGMYGFMDRLWTWVCHGALNQLNPTGQPIHPPVAYVKSSSCFIVPRADAPPVTGNGWAGFALLRPVANNRFDIIGWQHIAEVREPTGPVAPALLLNRDLPWEMPEKLDAVLCEVEACGLSRNAIIALLNWAVLRNTKEQPLIVVIGTPSRGIAGGQDIRQHLMAWAVDSVMVDALRLSLEKYSDHPKLQEIGERAHAIVLDWMKLASVNWCRVLEARAEVTLRRDAVSPLAVFRGRAVSVWGCGALGSHVAYYLAKAGVQRLILIDRGVVTPGLLVRQFFEDADIGLPKADALRQRLLRMCPHLQVDSRSCDLVQRLSPDRDWTESADFVLDCTASDVLCAKLESVLRAGQTRRVPVTSMVVGHRAERGIVVVVPSGHTGGPRDVFRKAKLAACRIQSLKTFVDDFYPEAGSLNFFQPEPGCSDATFVGSAADVAALSGLMLNFAAGKLEEAAAASASAAFVAQPQTANRRAGQIGFWTESWPSDAVCSGAYEVRITPAAWKEVAACIRGARRTKGRRVETGGLLFGNRDDALRIIWIDDAIGPPPDSRCSATEFICGIKGTTEANEGRRRVSRGSMRFVGMWHTHPEDIPMPSTTDRGGMERIISEGNLPPTKCLLLIVGWPSGRPVLGAALFEREGYGHGGERTVATVSMTEFPDLNL